MLSVGDIVTVSLDNEASNTYIIREKIQNDNYLLFHPLFPECFIIKSAKDLNKNAPNIKDSIERCLDFAIQNKNYLDFNTIADLEALCLYFSFRRRITPRQKHTLSIFCGTIASVKFDNNVVEAMHFISKNKGVLDDFNLMWFYNFKKLFIGEQPISSKKQRASIFNIAGFVLAQLNNPIALK